MGFGTNNGVAVERTGHKEGISLKVPYILFPTQALLEMLNSVTCIRREFISMGIIGISGQEKNIIFPGGGARVMVFGPIMNEVNKMANKINATCIKDSAPSSDSLMVSISRSSGKRQFLKHERVCPHILCFRVYYYLNKRYHPLLNIH
jgi:hypothetical protein